MQNKTLDYCRKKTVLLMHVKAEQFNKFLLCFSFQNGSATLEANSFPVGVDHVLKRFPPPGK